MTFSLHAKDSPVNPRVPLFEIGNFSSQYDTTLHSLEADLKRSVF